MSDDHDREARPARRSPAAPLAFAFLILAALFGGWNYVAGRGVQVEMKRQRDLAVHGDRLVSAMKDLEIGERGYVLTGRAEFLRPYDEAQPQVDRELAAIGALGIRRPAGTGAALAPVRELVERERAFFAGVVATRRDAGVEAATALVATGEGRRLMAAIGDAVREANARADATTAEIEAADGRRALALDLASFASAALAAGLLARQSLVRRREGQRSRERLADVLGNAPVGLGFLDPDLGLRHANRALAEMAGQGAGSGASLWSAHPALEARLRPALEAARDRGTAAADIDVAVPEAAVPGGLRHLRLGIYPLTRAEGGAAGVGVAAVDTTAATLAERRARDGEAVLRAVLDTLPVGVLIAEAPSGRITGHNARAEAILGHGVMPAAPGEGGPARWVGFHEDGRPVAPNEWPLIRVVRDGEALSELEVDYRCGDGRRAWIGFAGAPMRDAGGTLVGGVVVVSDIDARKRNEHALAAARDAAEAASRAKSTFLANMSHELRTPLSAIIGYAEMLQEEVGDGTEAGELTPDIARIENNARHLLGLINDVLDLSKIESGKMEVFLETFAVEPLLRDVAAGVGGLVAKKNNRLDLRLAPDLGALRSDVTKLRQILLNLVGNAAKFTENGIVTLSAARDMDGRGERLRFSVSDTGIGMSEEQLGRLFQRFSQADASTTRRFGGTGLGLSLIKAFADMLGAEVQVESALGLGSTFTVVFPVDARAGDGTASAVEPPEPDGGTDGAADENARDLVLVIDDDADQRNLLARFLRREGFGVHLAADGVAGLDAARRLHPRAVLLDVTMPALDGWSVLSEIKADPALAGTPVVMVTAVDQRSLATALGAADYMLKPVEWDRFSRVMDRFRTPEGGILLIEDSDVARVNIRAMLEADGWEVREAENGRDGLDRAAERRPEVVLLDLNMPVMDGFDFLKAFRALPGCADVPVVVLTARDLSRADRALLRGADRILDPGDAGLASVVERLQRLTTGG